MDHTAVPTTETIAEADYRARHWHWAEPGAVRIGTGVHRDATCAMFHDTFNPYKPSIIEWPRLTPDALQRLSSLPIWDIAVSTENKARARMRAYGASLQDPAWRDAILRNGWEENRHKEVLSHPGSKLRHFAEA